MVAIDHPPTLEVIQHSHNLVLDLLVWNGLPIGLLMLGVLLAWAWQVVRGLREPAAVLALAGVGVVFLHSMVEFAVEYSYFLLPIGLLMGGVSRSSAPHCTSRIPAAVPMAALAAAAVVSGLLAVDYLALEEESRAIRFSEARVGLDTDRAEPPRVLLLSQLDALLALAREPPASSGGDVSQTTLDRLGAVARRYPQGFALIRHAEALARAGRPADAQAALAPLCRTHSIGQCERARAFWKLLGERDPRVAGTAWPDDSTGTSRTR
jgi:hypothetical protein